jgi:folate-dependent phosphoribosylglycinamide formyltransferase PurN
MSNSKGLVIFYSKGLSSWLILSEFIEKYPELILKVIEFPTIPVNVENKPKPKLLTKIKKSSIHYLWFNVVTITGYNILSKLSGRNLSQLCKRKAIPHEKHNYIDQPLLNWVQKENVNYVFNLSSNIIKQDLLSSVGIGVLNYHCAPLPQYRGAANYFWLLIDENRHARGTFHYVSLGLDEGEIIDYSFDVQISKSTTSVFSLWLNIRLGAFHVLQKYVHYIETGNKMPSFQQDESLSKTRSFPQKMDINQLFKNGYKVFMMKDCFKFLYFSLIK